MGQWLIKSVHQFFIHLFVHVRQLLFVISGCEECNCSWTPGNQINTLLPLGQKLCVRTTDVGCHLCPRVIVRSRPIDRGTKLAWYAVCTKISIFNCWIGLNYTSTELLAMIARFTRSSEPYIVSVWLLLIVAKTSDETYICYVDSKWIESIFISLYAAANSYKIIRSSVPSI